MPIFLRSVGIVTALGFACLLGCGENGEKSSSGGGGAKGSSGETKAAPPTAKKIDVSKLPKLGDYLPPLAGGTIEIAGPDGWTVLPKNTKDPTMLAWYYLKDKASLPRIEIKVNDNPLTDITEVTEENVGEFSQKLKAEIKKTRSDKEIIEHCLPLLLEDGPWVRYVRVAKNRGGDLVQIQSLQTIRNDKIYSVDLLIDGVEAADMKKHKDSGYTVAAGIKFKGK